MKKASPPRDLLKGLDDQTIEAILGRMTHLRLAAEEYLCRQGDPGDSLYLITDGVVEVWLEQVAIAT